MNPKKMDPLDQSKKKKNTPKAQNFIEAFKDARPADQPASQLQPKKDEDRFNFEEFLNQQEKKIRRQEQLRFEAVRREEQVIFSREKQQIKVEVETIQAQIKNLAKEQVELMKEVDKTAFQAVVNPGVYHKNFFQRLLQLIKLAKEKVVESRTWLQLHNQRSQKRAYFWQNVKSSGTKFMLSQERYMSTQAG